ncbi:hypothetical protein Ais01nite_38750 [Asanoa ishikariensis]|uniref:Excreted virulence factor EspC, type VII ESX diderm n=1 Tax=Asanoa ishikariensis TaxID=137265 RepID=A0A1H3M0S4_9ACTN|nr:hypothetical protein [Asanoa ishikariensis]GIF65840.1 hypothetical protein Ais01nite_38750 [Asanoa ishikariensis]SDY70357.1 hypothetical protein SAMN05421684_1116 [Asanoa ishikariensis]
MDGDLRVDPGLLRDRATELDLVARALAVGRDDLCVPALEWSAGAALSGLTRDASSALGAAAARVARSGGLLRDAARSYEEADLRAAIRLHRVG